MQSIWQYRSYDEQTAAMISRELGLSSITAALLVQRGIQNAAQAREFLHADVAQLSDAVTMQGMSAAVERIRRALARQERIVVYGDYDVDGICSVVILCECLQLMGAKVEYYVPDRFSEGYGLNIEALEGLAAREVGLVITVDCGISSVVEVLRARELGLDVIITDHHTLPPALPDAAAIINPKLEDNRKLHALAGAGVAFKLAVALTAGQAMAEIIDSWLELVALATIADQVPLRGENRIMVRHGLSALSQTPRIGLRALLRATGMEGRPIQSWQVGFILAPRLNSAGRMESARTSIELLASHDPYLAQGLAERLCRMNDERKIIEERIFGEALAQLEKSEDPPGSGVIVVTGDNWHRGVIGIVASRLAEAYQAPALVIAWEGDVGRGSARSWGDFDIYGALSCSRDTLSAYGGHRAAAGFNLSRQQFDLFRTMLAAQNPGGAELGPRARIQGVDLEIAEQDIDESLLREMDLLRPFGEGNPAPRFVLRGKKLNRISRVGKNGEHLRFSLGSRRIAGIMFNRGAMSDCQLDCSTQDLLFELDRNYFAGQSSLQIKVRDIRPAFITEQKVAPDSNFSGRLEILAQASREIELCRPVIMVYPGQRCLLKHRGVALTFFGNRILQEVHGLVPAAIREQALEQLRQGTGRIFLTTQAFWDATLVESGLPQNLRMVVQMWGDRGCQRTPPEVRAIEPVIWDLPAVPLHPGWQPGEPLRDGSIAIYANLGSTVRRYQELYPDSVVESGLKDMEARRAIRQHFCQTSDRILITDGTHTPGQPLLDRWDRLILADCPLGRYELAAWTDYMFKDHPLAAVIGFDRASLEYYRRHLQRLYPDQATARLILAGLWTQSGRQALQLQEQVRKLYHELEGRFSPEEILATLRIAAEMGLCRYEKSGSIMATNLLESRLYLEDWDLSPYVREGTAEQALFAHWEAIVKQAMGW